MKAATAVAAQPQDDLSLDEGTVSGVMEPRIRAMLYGEQKLGKSTFGSKAPNPYFIDIERGSGAFDVGRYFPETWDDILDRIERLTVRKHDYKTVVVDTVDAAEGLLWDKICEAAGEPSINQGKLGYGKGHDEAQTHWRKLLYALERLQAKRNVGVILLAHSTIKQWHDPAGTSFDRYIPRMNEKIAGSTAQWVDDILFARLQTTFKIDKNTKRAKGVSTEVRVVHTRPSATWVAGCRSNLPEELPLEWADYIEAMKNAKPADPDELIAAITENAKRLPEDKQKLTTASLARNGRDAVKLAQLDNWVRSLLPAPEAE